MWRHAVFGYKGFVAMYWIWFTIHFIFVYVNIKLEDKILYYMYIIGVSGSARVFLYGVCMFSSCQGGFSQGISSHICRLGLGLFMSAVIGSSSQDKRYITSHHISFSWDFYKATSNKYIQSWGYKPKTARIICIDNELMGWIVWFMSHPLTRVYDLYCS